MNNITANRFLETVFPQHLVVPNEAPVIAWPDSFTSQDTGLEVSYYSQRHWTHRGIVPRGKATYFCVSTVCRQNKRQVKKRLQDVRTAMVIVLDDVGSKSTPPNVQPSYVLETSANNYQWGYLLEPYDVSGPTGQAYFDSVLWSLAEAGHNDPGCRSASRLMRLPGSVHRTGFEARVVEWRPELSWELEDLVAAFNVPMVKPRKIQAVKPGKHTHLDEVDDPVYRWIADNWTVYGHNEEWVHVECPWREHHTDGRQGPSSTSYSPKDYGTKGVGFKCLHGHCVHRSAVDFVQWVLRRRNTEAVLTGNIPILN